MHENTPYFFIFPFCEMFRGILPPSPPPHGTTPEYLWWNLKNQIQWIYIINLFDRNKYWNKDLKVFVSILIPVS